MGRVLRLLLVLRDSCGCVFPSKRQQKSLPVEGGAIGWVGWGLGGSSLKEERVLLANVSGAPASSNPNLSLSLPFTHHFHHFKPGMGLGGASAPLQLGVEKSITHLTYILK